MSNDAAMIAVNWLLLDNDDEEEEEEILLRFFFGELAVVALGFFFFAMIDWYGCSDVNRDAMRTKDRDSRTCHSDINSDFRLSITLLSSVSAERLATNSSR